MRPLEKSMGEGGASMQFGNAPRALQPLDKKNAENQLRELAASAKENGLTGLAAALTQKNENTSFLASVLDLSSFIRDALMVRPEILDALIGGPLDARIDTIISGISALGSSEFSEAALMTDLRRAKLEAHVLIALGDLAGVFGGEETTRRVSALAVACVSAAVNFLLRDARAKGILALEDPEFPAKNCGWIILAMGKLGARELNYSSDIDLIVFFDGQTQALKDRYEGVEIYAKLTRRLVRILQERTADGYVFRTDMRLRPDPGSTPVAIPVEMALNYYESRGQNWERAAMIKALPVAADIAAGEAFLKELTPYIWRKYLDYAAIADVHSIKRQIHAHKGHGEIAVLGHDLKLGRGGIREIEFFVQTQQLIAGGRAPDLRGRQTVPMLAKLAEHGWIKPETCDALAREYWFLRDLEHRVQMVADEQTHMLPRDEEGLRRIALMAGFFDTKTFSAAVRASLQTVETHYSALFETAPQLSTGIGNLVFTGDKDDPGTLETMAKLGFKRPSDICRIIRVWHFGRYKATQSAEARERLTEITPALLKAFGAAKDADDAILRFDEFLSGLPAGIQLFSLLNSNPSLLDLLVLIMGSAPRLAEIIARKPHIFDGLLDPAIYRDIPTEAYLSERLSAFLLNVTDYEEILDRLRIFGAEQKFLIGVRVLTGAIPPQTAARAFSDLADILLQQTLAAVTREFETKYGKVTGGVTAMLGMGKLGSQELTAGSDIDLILLYDHSDDEESDGERPLAPSTYFMRLTQRLIAGISAPTAEGILYEVDLRLRPSGNKGPVATRFSAFSEYQRKDAWTWEHMALSRARVVAGQGQFSGKINAEVTSILTLPRDSSKVAKEVGDMRALIGKEKAPKGIWDLKLMPGGLIDLEFLTQFAALTRQTGIKTVETAKALSHLSIVNLQEDARAELADAHFLFSNLTQVLRLCLKAEPADEELPQGLSDIMCRLSGLPDTAALAAHVKDTARKVRVIFDQTLR
jgi:[glutamine synthetase] adenylyltransferase / [glutamine synthetase]-adenylyl-L-tyrosine phosphorylase